jgi:hypothetical protein
VTSAYDRDARWSLLRAIEVFVRYAESERESSDTKAPVSGKLSAEDALAQEIVVKAHYIARGVTQVASALLASLPNDPVLIPSVRFVV